MRVAASHDTHSWLCGHESPYKQHLTPFATDPHRLHPRPSHLVSCCQQRDGVDERGHSERDACKASAWRHVGCSQQNILRDGRCHSLQPQKVSLRLCQTTKQTVCAHAWMHAAVGAHLPPCGLPSRARSTQCLALCLAHATPCVQSCIATVLAST